MNPEERKLRQIRRRAFVRAARRMREEEIRQDTQDTLDTLQDATGLSRLELETIAQEVQASFKPHTREFFSIKSQFLLVGAGLGLLFITLWTLIEVIF